MRGQEQGWVEIRRVKGDMWIRNDPTFLVEGLPFKHTPVSSPVKM